MCRLLAAVALALLCSSGASMEDAGCMQVVHPPVNYVLAPDEQHSIELVLQVNCPGAARARLLQLYSATGNGTAGNMQCACQNSLHIYCARFCLNSTRMLPLTLCGDLRYAEHRRCAKANASAVGREKVKVQY